MTPVKKYPLLALPDGQLLGQCRFEACRGTGPGGQKRNKTSTAARVTHEATGISVWDDTTRSQHQNLRLALRRLRWELAVFLPPEVGELPPGIPLSPVPGESSPQYPLWLGKVFDALRRGEYNIASAAADLGCTPSRLLRLMGREPFAWQKLAEERQRRQLPPLHR